MQLISLTLSREGRGLLLGAAASAGVLAVTFATSEIVRHLSSRNSPAIERALAASSVAEAPEDPAITAGRHLFAVNCAHCHGDDATGDECPDLHGLKKTDERIAKLIKEGAKGEMPSFRKKLDDAGVADLIAFLRSLKG